VLPTDKVQSVLNTAAVIESDLMATDETQPSDSTFIEPTSGSVVEISGVNNSIIGGGNLVLGSLSEPENSSSSTTSAMAINAVESINGGKLSVPEVTTTPDAMTTGGGIISPITNSATTGTDVVSINSGAAMFLGSFIEKNSGIHNGGCFQYDYQFKHN